MLAPVPLAASAGGVLASSKRVFVTRARFFFTCPAETFAAAGGVLASSNWTLSPFFSNPYFIFSFALFHFIFFRFHFLNGILDRMSGPVVTDSEILQNGLTTHKHVHRM